MNRAFCTAACTCLIAAVAAVSIPAITRAAPTIAEPAAQPAPAMSDADILGTLMTINNGEIAAANLALDEKNVTGDVKDYAQMMKKDHTANNLATQKLADKLGVKPVPPEAAKEMAKQDAEMLTKMRSMDTPAFSKAYIDMMVMGHTKALATLDAATAATSNEDLKDHLKTTRETVQKHTDEAKKIQGDLNKM